MNANTRTIIFGPIAILLIMSVIFSETESSESSNNYNQNKDPKLIQDIKDVDSKIKAFKAKEYEKREEVKKHFLNKEPKVKDAIWHSENNFAVGVFDNGTRRDGYAMYVCNILYEYGFKGKGILVQVLDVVKMNQSKKQMVLGKYSCDDFIKSNEYSYSAKTYSWLYDKNEDKARQKPIYTASVFSKGLVELDFPYHGGSYVIMTIRKHPEWGQDIYFRVNKGQYKCGYDGCIGLINVDGKVENLTLIEPDDNSNDTLFAKYSDAILKKILNSKNIIVELPFYQDGRQQFEFDTEGLKWSPEDHLKYYSE